MELVKEVKFNSCRVSLSGEINIVSSGYNDRYVTGHLIGNIEKDHVVFSVDSDALISAILVLEGIKCDSNDYEVFQEQTRKNFERVQKQTRRLEPTTRMRVRNEKSGTTIIVEISSAELADGLNWAIKHAGEKPNLTELQWNAIEYRLDEINAIHARVGKPVVEFKI